MSERAGENAGWQNFEKHLAHGQAIFQRRFPFLKHVLPSNGSILEIGCSSGFMLHPLLGEHECVGIEPSGYFGTFLESSGINHFESIEQFKLNMPSKKFDLIMHFFVLEHIRNPIDFLLESISLLNPGGKIFFEIPNANDPLHTLFDIPEFEKFYWSKAHPWYFTESSLNFLLSKLNHEFEITLEQRYDLSNHLVWARDGKPGGMFKFSDIFGEEFDRTYKQMLIDSGHCDTLYGVIKK